MPSPVSHLVVLMLENRSFDSVFGLQRPKGPDFDGLDGTEANPLATEGAVAVRKLGGEEGMVTDPDPPHEHDDAMFHLFGERASAGDNQGFAARYQTHARQGEILAPAVVENVMSVFDARSQLPALSTLADEFRICDAWFSSLPGPTWPNRFFAHCATSGGHVESPTDFSAVWSEVGSLYDMPTIFESLSARGESWNIYYHDIPQSLGLARLHRARDHFKHFSSFLQDCASGDLPSYAFVEPGFFDAKALNLAANDMHPPHDVRRADALVASVYGALRANEALWRRSMLLVVWDEHGGFYDHVPPPPAVSPDPAPPASVFSFDRLGVRVPAIVVSPWVAKGTADHTVYDHASIPAALKELFAIPSFLTRRDAGASSFVRDLLSEPRRDTPRSIAHAAPPAALGDERALLPHHQALLSMASRLRVPGIPSPAETAVEAAILHVARYLGA